MTQRVKFSLDLKKSSQPSLKKKNQNFMATMALFKIYHKHILSVPPFENF